MHSISLDLASSDFHLFLHLKKFLSSLQQRFQNDREAEMSVTQWFQSQAAEFDTWIQKLVPLYDKYAEKYLNTVLSVPINLSIKLGFVSVNSPRETYFVYPLCILVNYPELCAIGLWLPTSQNLFLVFSIEKTY